jgi:hypothetical protein
MSGFLSFGGCDWIVDMLNGIVSFHGQDFSLSRLVLMSGAMGFLFMG